MIKSFKNKKLAPPHPGKILFKEFLNPMGISQYMFTKQMMV